MESSWLIITIPWGTRGLRKQLAISGEEGQTPAPHDSTRWLMAILSRLFNWRDALVAVKPETLVRWHRKGFRPFWRWKSKPSGRPPLPANIRQLIRTIHADNVTWSEERIANGRAGAFRQSY